MTTYELLCCIWTVTLHLSHYVQLRVIFISGIQLRVQAGILNFCQEGKDEVDLVQITGIRRYDRRAGVVGVPTA